MKPRVIVALLTVLVFSVGFAAGLWAERHRPLPPPPGALMGEFAGPRAQSSTTGGPSRPPANRAQLAADIERLRPQIAAYRARLDDIDAAFDRELAAFLNADQIERYTAAQKRRAERSARGDAKAAADASPLSDEDIERLRQRSLYGLLWMVTPSMKLDALVHDLKIDELQQAKARQLLLARREKYLALIDSTPPPSVMLSRLAPLTQRLVDPTKPALPPVDPPKN